MLDQDRVGNVESVVFQVSYTSYGEVVTKDLKRNGSQIAVTNENRDGSFKISGTMSCFVKMTIDFMSFCILSSLSH